jgi:hypothetical protein
VNKRRLQKEKEKEMEKEKEKEKEMEKEKEKERSRHRHRHHRRILKNLASRTDPNQNNRRIQVLLIKMIKMENRTMYLKGNQLNHH